MRVSPPTAGALGSSRPERSRRAWPAVLLVGAGLGDAWWVASTQPFTAWARVAVLAGAAVIGIVAAGAWRRRSPGSLPGRASVAAWMVVAAAIVAFELMVLIAGAVAGRHAFPTVSSLYDAVARWRGAKAAVVVVWLALGWALFRR